MITGKELYEKFGSPIDFASTPKVNEQSIFESKHMTLFTLPTLYNPIDAMPKRIYCNRLMVQPLKEALINVSAAGVHQEIKTFDGCFNVRPIRGYEKKFQDYMLAGKFEKAMELLSTHAWACGIDINATWNRLGQKPTMSRRLVECFTSVGFDWGGFFERKDGMHFQLSSIKTIQNANTKTAS